LNYQLTIIRNEMDNIEVKIMIIIIKRTNWMIMEQK